ncbi:hypothetical protein MTR67_038857 [Solanum verrucosum]|uniref:Uncharacterized protein n=1 Tax=Solanum verrucosum TaxID=315347 RepID=A0AAF0UG77_SOLVR|nr:hypothetical protein MTR67_038857 [Solanum verrucosum]
MGLRLRTSHHCGLVTLSSKQEIRRARFKEKNKVVTDGTLPVCDRMVSILFDPGSTFSYVSSLLANGLDLHCDFLDMPIRVSTRVGFLAHIRDHSSKVPSIESALIVHEFVDVFPADVPCMSPDRDIDFCIDLEPGTRPISIPTYRMVPTELRELKSQLQELLGENFIIPITSPWGAPVLFVKKKGGSFRMCIDYMQLNKKIEVVKSWTRPTNVSEVKSFVGLSSYYRREFSETQDLVATAPFLAFLVEGKDFIVYCNTSYSGLGAVLMQERDVKYEHQRPGETLRIMPIPKWKWERIAMDFVVGLPKTLSGDFNTVLNEEEKIGGNTILPQDTEEFSLCISSSELYEVGFKGSPFTWWNGRIAKDSIFERLDRVVEERDYILEQIANANGELVEEEHKIAEAAINFYQSQFTQGEEGSDFNILKNVLQTNEEENIRINALLDLEKSREVVFSLDGSSSTGPDGLTGDYFFQKCWKIVQSDIVDVVQAFFKDCDRVHGPLTSPRTPLPPSRGGPRSPSQVVKHLTSRAGTHGNQIESTRLRHQTMNPIMGRGLNNKPWWLP